MVRVRLEELQESEVGALNWSLFSVPTLQSHFHLRIVFPYLFLRNIVTNLLNKKRPEGFQHFSRLKFQSLPAESASSRSLSSAHTQGTIQYTAFRF